MSYDILLSPRRPGQDWEEVLVQDAAGPGPDQTLDDEATLAAGVATWRRIEDRLRQALPGPVETWVAEQPGGDGYGELSVPASGLQVELHQRSAAVSFAYWEHDDLDGFHAQVREAVRIVAEETGYEAYDPQTEAAFDGTFADEPGREAARQQGQEGMAFVPTSDDPTPAEEARAGVPLDPRHTSERMRRRAVLYLVLGLVLTFFAVWRLSIDRGGVLIIVLLVIGIVDLVGGAFMLWAAGQMRRRGPSAGGQ